MSYQRAVEFIALNDEDSNLDDLSGLSEQLTVVLVSDNTGKSAETVAADVMRVRRANRTGG